MSDTPTAPPGAGPEVMVRMWAVEGVMKSRKGSGGGVLASTFDAQYVVDVAAVLESYVLNGKPVQVAAT